MGEDRSGWAAADFERGFDLPADLGRDLWIELSGGTADQFRLNEPSGRWEG
jgi:hypothetical protein